MLVATRDVPRLAVGQTAAPRIDGLDGETITGKVLRINPVANEGSRFISVHIELDNPDSRLQGGMFATGTILVDERKNVLAAPVTSLREDEAGTYALKLDKGRLKRQPVTVGTTWRSGMIEILDGIVPGDTILIAPLPGLVDGVAISVAGD